MTEPYMPEMPTPDPELQRLDYLVGRWRVTGNTADCPDGPTAEISKTESFEWLPGGFYLLHRWEGSVDVGERRMVDAGYEFLDYVAATGHYRGQRFSSFGPWSDGESEYVGEFVGDSLVMKGSPRTTYTRQSDDTIVCEAELLNEKSEWIPFIRTTLVRID